MAGLDPAIHAFSLIWIQDVDARDKRGHDVKSIDFERRPALANPGFPFVWCDPSRRSDHHA